MYVSTLRKDIEAMGGELEIIAKFPEGSVRIKPMRGQGDLERPSVPGRAAIMGARHATGSAFPGRARGGGDATLRLVVKMAREVRGDD